MEKVVLASTVWFPLAHLMVHSALDTPVVTSLLHYTKNRWMLHYQVCTIAVTEVTAEPVNFSITENRRIFPSCFSCSYTFTPHVKAPVRHFHLWHIGESLPSG